MTLAPIGNLTPRHQATDADAKSVAEARQAAQQFESIFLRQLLGAMEKTGGLGGSSQGSAIYKSMMVGALADNASQSGGIGLADVVFKAMLPPEVAARVAAGHGAAGTTTAATAAASNESSGAASDAVNSAISGAGAALGAAGFAVAPLARKAVASIPLAAQRAPVPLAPVSLAPVSLAPVRAGGGR
jgi:Rod binding domain-containing protein